MAEKHCVNAASTAPRVCQAKSAKWPHVSNLLGAKINKRSLKSEADTWTSIFLKDKDGRRPVNGGEKKLQEDPHWRDCILFYEYFHGDNGAGLGAMAE